jgi:hypothetical protein
VECREPCFLTSSNVWSSNARTARSPRNLSRPVPTGGLARSARAALMALHLSGVVFRRRWKAAAAQAMGRTVCRPDAAAAAGPGCGSAATSGTAAVAVASARSRRRSTRRYRALRRDTNPGRSSASRGAQDGKLRRSWGGYPPIKTSKPRWGKRTSFDGEISHCLLPHPMSALHLIVTIRRTCREVAFVPGTEVSYFIRLSGRRDQAASVGR